MAKSLNIFEFSDYRKYLRAWIANARKEKTSNVSRVAEVLGVHTTLISHVLSGTKDLSQEHLIILSREFRLTKTERDYFLALLNVAKAGTAELKEYWIEKQNSILAEKNKIGTRIGDHEELTETEKTTFYSSWIYLAVFAASSISEGQTVTQIATRFGLSRDYAEEILDFLVRAGICEKFRDHYKPGKTMVYVPNSSPHVVKHHTNWRIKAIQKMDKRKEKELFFTFPMSIGSKDFDIAREKIAAVIKEITQLCRDSEPTEVACLNIDLFQIASDE